MAQQQRTIQLLENLSSHEVPDLVRALTPGRVGVLLARDAATSGQGQLLLSFVVNLLTRLYPVVQELDVFVDGDGQLLAPVPRWRGRTLCGHLERMLHAVSSPVKWRLNSASSSVNSDSSEILVIGDTLQRGSVYVGVKGWNVYVSSERPQNVSGDGNPVSINAAACFGVSEVFKRLLVRHTNLFSNVPVVPLAGHLVFSTLTYRTGEDQEELPFPETVDLGGLTLVGLGAGGGATAFTLASLSSLRGHVNLIEPDEIVESNLNRYVFADASDAHDGRSKTDVVADLFRSQSGLILKKYRHAFSDVVAEIPIDDFRQVSAAVHSREARREIQYETPRVLWDAAASEDGEFRIWRSIFGKSECMFCKHPRNEQDPERKRALQLAKVLGIAVDSLLNKIKNNGTFTSTDCERILAHVDGTQEFELPSPNQRLDDWESSQCGRLHLSTVEDDVPIPFSPVMAGVLIAGEIIKERLFQELVLDSYYFNTLLGNFMTRVVPNRRRPRDECEHCGDLVFQRQYRRRWGSGVSSCRSLD